VKNSNIATKIAMISNTRHTDGGYRTWLGNHESRQSFSTNSISFYIQHIKYDTHSLTYLLSNLSGNRATFIPRFIQCSTQRIAIPSITHAD